MIESMTCYIITSGSVYYIERTHLNSFKKTKEFTSGCIYLNNDLAEQVVKNLYEQDLMKLTFKNLQIHEYSLVKGILSDDEKAQYKTPKKKSSGRPKKKDTIELLNHKLSELNLELGIEENLNILAAANYNEASKVISNITGENTKVSFNSNGAEYVAEISFNENEIDIIIIDKESYIEDFGNDGII